MLNGLFRDLKAAHENPNVEAIVITGAGGGCCWAAFTGRPSQHAAAAPSHAVLCGVSLRLAQPGDCSVAVQLLFLCPCMFAGKFCAGFDIHQFATGGVGLDNRINDAFCSLVRPARMPAVHPPCNTVPCRPMELVWRCG